MTRDKNASHNVCVSVPGIPLVRMERIRELKSPPIIEKFESVIGYLCLIDFTLGFIR